MDNGRMVVKDNRKFSRIYPNKLPIRFFVKYLGVWKIISLDW